MKKFQNILVAFDLNQTLFYKSQSPLPRRHDAKIRKIFFYVRPYLKQLISFLHSNQINYCFWSNMMAHNCTKYIKQLENIGMTKYCGIFDQQFCDKLQNQDKNSQKIKCVKDLNKLAQLFDIDVDSCVLVDDSKQKSVKGCHLIEVISFEGKQTDNDLLNVIEKLRQFRSQRVNVDDKNLPMLKYTQYDPLLLPPPKKVPKQKIQQPRIHQPTQIEKLIETNPQLIKLKKDLVLEKEIKKNIIKQIENVQKDILKIGEQVKKKSQGKVVRKGDGLLVEVLMFAKHKKVSEKKLQELNQKKKNSIQKIQLIKKLMKTIVQKLHPKLDQKKLFHEEDETPQKKQIDSQNLKLMNQKKQETKPTQ